MLLFELLSRLQNSNTSLLFWKFFTGLKFLNEMSIKSSLSLTKLSIPLSHCILHLFSLLMVTTHALHLVTLIKPSSNHHSKSLTAPSDMLHLIFGTNFLHCSEFLIQIIHPPLSDLHLNTCRFNLLPSEGGRLSRPRHCNKCAAHAQSCNCSSFHEKHRSCLQQGFDPGTSHAAGHQHMHELTLWQTRLFVSCLIM